MRLPTTSTTTPPPLLILLSLLPSTLATLLTLTLPASLQSTSLPYSTHATLTTTNLTLSAPLRRTNTFVFASPPPGSYLAEVNCRDYAFAPLRVDVDAVGGVEAWQTFRGNEWGNKGERICAGGGGGGGGGDGKGTEEVRCEVRTLGEKGYYEARGGFNIMSYLKSPMILIAIAGMGMMVGMPYLLDSMDPETKKEFEEAQKSGPLAGVSSAAANPMQGFDMAAWMAGSGKSASSGADETPARGVRKRG